MFRQENGYLPCLGNGAVIQNVVLPSEFRFDAESAQERFSKDYRQAMESDLVPVISREGLCGTPYMVGTMVLR